jgi:hypothetical protein
MSRVYRFLALVPALVALFSLLLSAMAAGGPCPPFDPGC